MNTKECEDVLMAVMAAEDGEEVGLSLDRIEAHLAGCENCRLEAGRGEAIAGLLKGYERRELDADLWPAVGERIRAAASPERSRGWYIFAALTSLLILYKLVEMLPRAEPGYLLKIAPVVAAAALFVFLRENPFRINTELITE